MWGMHPLRREYYYNSSTLYSTDYTLLSKNDTMILSTSAHGSGVVDAFVTKPSASRSTAVVQGPDIDKTSNLYSLSNLHTQLKTQLALTRVLRMQKYCYGYTNAKIANLRVIHSLLHPNIYPHPQLMID